MTSREGQTFVLIGHPVGHSISPAIHQAAYDALGLSYRYVCVDCPDETAVSRQLEALRRGEVGGANVTVPHKRLALRLADSVEGAARDAGAANVLVPEPGGATATYRISAHNTDVGALADELSSGRPGARKAAIIGSGGAALAAVVACRSLGVGDIAVTARRFEGDQPREAWPGAADLRALGARPVSWPASPATRDAFAQVVASADVIVQATSAGMKGADSGNRVRDLVPWDVIRDGAFAYDVVYNPPSTPFLEAARRHGVRAEGGLGMLVGQAARALTLWLGVEAPVPVMRRAAEQALFGGARG